MRIMRNLTFFLVKHSSPFWQATCQWHPNLFFFCSFVCLNVAINKWGGKKSRHVIPINSNQSVFYCKLPKSCHPTPMPIAFHWKENQCVFVFQVGKARMLKIAQLLQLIEPVVGKKNMPNSITSWTDDSENETEASLRPLLDGNAIQIMACFL